MHGRATTNDEERAIVGSHRTNVQQPALIASRLDPTSVTVSPNRADPLRWANPSGTLWAMGLTKVTAKLTSLVDPKRSFESLFLVDTRATDSMAPSDELEKLGVKQEGKMAYELADGTVREYPFGLVRIEFMGETTAGRVIFANPGVEPVLGVTALESVGIMVDPTNKTLKRLPAIPLK